MLWAVMLVLLQLSINTTNSKQVDKVSIIVRLNLIIANLDGPDNVMHSTCQQR